ncbi:MAG: hypothetical protein E7553_00875 [Ruminococcaceae bacterium]|nr:hypothetical protein [Oscillospiraceae bacterium]
MANMNELLQEMVNKDYDELVEFGKIALSKLLPYLKQLDEENDGFFLLTSIILSAIGADGKLSALERRFLKDVVGLSDEGVDNLIKLYTAKSEDLTDALFDSAASNDFRGDLTMFILAIMAVDEHITREETAFIKKLFE